MSMQLERSARTPVAPTLVSDNDGLANISVKRTKVELDPERRNAMIAEAAYYRAERRGFESGFELEDWLEAEAEIDGKFTDGEIPLACGI